MTASQKNERLKALGRIRQASCYEGFYNLSHFDNAKYECDYVTPYTKGSGNVNSDIFIMLQDWTSKDRILQGLGEDAVTLGYMPSLPTNKNLKVLLHETFGLNIAEAFTTNLFPYIKPGKMDAPIPQRILERAFKEFALPQIQIVQPRLVICCGATVYKTAISHFIIVKQKKYPLNHHFSRDGIIYCYQNHPGFSGTISAGGILEVKKNWEFMKSLIT